VYQYLKAYQFYTKKGIVVSYKRKDGILIHDDPADFAKMRVAGKLAAECLDFITPYVQVGVSTEELDNLCNKFILDHHAVPACLGYHGYPKTICTSINHVICHGIPDERKLVDGDIINIDVTVIVDGWYGDTSRMYYVGNPKIKAKRLCEVTYECLMRAIDVVKPGARMGDIGAVIEEYAHKYGYSVVEMFCGHGLGQVFHDEPNVLHFGRKGTGALIEEGMFFTIEPMINIGKPDGIILQNGWTATTRDKSLSAQFEHSLGVTSDGCEVFTFSPKGLDKPPYKL